MSSSLIIPSPSTSKTTQPVPNFSLALSTIQNIESSFQFKVFVPNFGRVTGSHKDFLSQTNRLQKRFSFAYFSNIIMVSEPQIGLNDKLKFYGVDPSSATAQKHRHKDVGKSFPLSSVIIAVAKSFERFGKGRDWRKFCFSQRVPRRERQLFHPMLQDGVF